MSPDRKGFTSNTPVIFTSDNGGAKKPTLTGPETDASRSWTWRLSGPFRGGKHDVWQGGLACHVYYPLVRGKAAPAATGSDETMSPTDISEPR